MRQLIVFFCLVSTALAGNRVALVIGNNTYKSATPLTNCVRDAQSIAGAFESLGFKVRTLTDAGRSEMTGGLAWFDTEVRGAELGVFYFSGHGVQVNGVNYLLPIDLDLGDAHLEGQVRRNALDANEVADTLMQSGCKASVVILDACRNNPFKSSKRALGQRGLAQMSAADDSLIAFAADAGQTADDNPGGSNGLYTEELLKHLTVPGLTVEQVFKRTRKAVKGRSGNQQVPAEYSRLVDDVYFAPPVAEVPPARPSPPDDHAHRPSSPAPAHNEYPPIATPVATPVGEPAKPKPSRGIVLVTSMPVGATVVVDGEARGVTPLEIEESPGEHLIVVRAHGYYSGITKLEFLAGERLSWTTTLKSRRR